MLGDGGGGEEVQVWRECLLVTWDQFPVSSGLPWNLLVEKTHLMYKTRLQTEGDSLKHLRNGLTAWNKFSSHWTSGSKGQWSLRRENGNKSDLCGAEHLPWESVLAQLQGGVQAGGTQKTPESRRQGWESGKTKAAGVHRKSTRVDCTAQRENSGDLQRAPPWVFSWVLLVSVCENTTGAWGINYPREIRDSTVLGAHVQTGKYLFSPARLENLTMRGHWLQYSEQTCPGVENHQPYTEHCEVPPNTLRSKILKDQTVST